MSGRRAVLSVAFTDVVCSGAVSAAGGRSSIISADLRQWLTYIVSDDLQGRAVYSEGFGLAAGYIQTHLQEWGVEPRGDGASYRQTVSVQGVRSTNHSTVTVQVGKEVRTFKDGDGITFPKFVGSKRTFTTDRVEFAAYGLDAPGAHYSDLAGHDFRGAAVVYLGAAPPESIDASIGRRLLYGRPRWLTGQMQAVAAIGPASAVRSESPRPDQNGRQPRPDFTTTERLDRVEAPALTASDQFLQFLFSRA